MSKRFAYKVLKKKIKQKWVAKYQIIDLQHQYAAMWQSERLVLEKVVGVRKKMSDRLVMLI